MKLLYVTSLSGKRINRFMKSAIVAAKELNIEFDIACNMDGADKIGYQHDCDTYGIKAHHIPFHRNPLSPKNIRAYSKLKRLMKDNNYDIVHCNTPIGGLLGRLCAKKMDIKSVIYQAHGFHFWKGAPLKNWLFYYPIEKKLAKVTDYYLTINKEDFTLSQKFKIRYGGLRKLIHGVGIDKIRTISDAEKTSLKNSLGIFNNQKVLISVGELNNNKNHKLLINALSKIKNDSIVCLICGEGKKRNFLEKMIKAKHLENVVHLLGFRSDVDKLLQISSLFIFPSFREGLPISLMEAIECSVPCSASRIRGVVDLLPGSSLLFSPNSVNELTAAINQLNNRDLLNNEIAINSINISKYEFDNVVKELKDIYSLASKKVLGSNE
jgi:glycosyltransferase involved in cell wall biosynthesis